MVSTSTLPRHFHPKILPVDHEWKKHTKSLNSSGNYGGQRLKFNEVVCVKRKTEFKGLVVKAVSSAAALPPPPGQSGKNDWKVYGKSRKSKGVLVKVVAEVIAWLFGGFRMFVLTVLWKLVATVLPKPTKKALEENKSSSEVPVWSFGKKLLYEFSAKMERESKQHLYDYAKDLRSLRIVNLSGGDLGDEGLFILAESLVDNQNLEELNLSSNGITGAGLKALDGVLQSNVVLKTLNLSGNPIGEEGAKCLCDILVDNTGIKKLQLNRARIGNEGSKAIAQMLIRNSRLQILELDNNSIDNHGFSELARSLVGNETLHTMYLNRNYGGALGASALAEGLERNRSLRELYLNGNSIGDAGARALVSGLLSHKGELVSLDLGNNGISSSGATYVAEYIRSSKTLLWMSLFMNDLRDEGMAKIAAALRHCTIRSIDLGENDIGERGIYNINQAVHQNPLIASVNL
ncbi:Chloroplast envelope protein 1 [Heracleum sosnowskyi]|uniref:Chloroplast envelope protein 1 n=1 Tax=Heracleum sosnowskyi TaxID=360622 RepID=A0AAD8MQ83_9APIA|nr:Chloroplast envelope protein 1 [Heracleum sosnowskyi]